ncbi:MAG: response regulator [Oscillospiraceae bacterium]|nr:response regulator [Oscillospiraceae bacterium]
MSDLVRVWLAESDFDTSRELAQVLRAESDIDLVGYSDDGLEALYAVETLQPDILIVSLALRGADGLSVIEQLSKQPLIKFPRIAVITVMPQEIAERALQLGADIWFPKPVNVPRLLSWIRSGSTLTAVASPTMGDRKDIAARALEMIGMNKTLQGYRYLVEAASMASCDHQLPQRMMSDLYPRLAEMFDTTPTRAERAMRHAIEETWTSGKLTATDKLFGYSVDPKRGKPTNSECIARLAEYVRFVLSGTSDVLSGEAVSAKQA